ncbi:hypothetical protein [Pontibacter sp. G13]|uniref:hypothetical protein n=1 Tax=Pontibacter sp. G13 TaxID=3074898 RepID=UPI00288B5D87|nr:hypothetical protein [Pontibacter sp. G13]WNJ21164.1 hypothetical protein RJD25_11910 [Pontibacter sp. G13]
MNFLSHFYLDWHLDDSLFFMGVSTPDLVSVFDRNVRLKENRMPSFIPGETPPNCESFRIGVLRHFEVDRIFHTSDFFYEETHRLSRMIESRIPAHELHRVFFVSHVLFELVLDKILIHEEPDLLPAFYRHLEEYSIPEFVKLTEWVTQVDMPGYDGFLNRFMSKRYLREYTDWQQVFFILRKIMVGVGITKYQYLKDPVFFDLMKEYEAGLAERFQDGFAQIQLQLRLV